MPRRLSAPAACAALLVARSATLEARTIKLGDVAIPGSIRTRGEINDGGYSSRVGIGGYVGDAPGHAVAQSIYRTSAHTRFAYAEVTVRF